MPHTPKVTGVTFLKRFKKAFEKLDPVVRERVLEAIETLKTHPEQPGLRLKKIQGFDDIYAIRVGRNYRVTLNIDDGVAVLRNVATHDKLYDNP